MEKDKTNIGAILAIFALIAGCVFLFFPIIKVDIINYEINYIYNNGELADGIFIIVCSFFAFIALLAKVDAIALIPIAINCVLLVNLYNNENNTFTKYGVGGFTIFYYLIVICQAIAIIGTIVAVITRKKKPKPAPVVLNGRYNYNQPINYNNGYYNQQPQYNNQYQNQSVVSYEEHSTGNLGYCTGCGQRKTNSGAFCTNCGKKF